MELIRGKITSELSMNQSGCFFLPQPTDFSAIVRTHDLTIFQFCSGELAIERMRVFTQLLPGCLDISSCMIDPAISEQQKEWSYHFSHV